MPQQESTIRIAEILRTIGHPLRVRMIEVLVEKKELTVKDLCQYLDTEQSLMSHHLNYMRIRGLLNSSRKGKNVFYSIRSQSAMDLIRLLRALEAQQ